MAAANNTDTKTEIDDWMGKLDINQDDQENIIPKSANIHQLISFQSESNKQTMKTLISCMTEALGDQATLLDRIVTIPSLHSVPPVSRVYPCLVTAAG